MADHEQDAQRFAEGIGSQYFADVCEALQREYELSGDVAQQIALTALKTRCYAIRDMLHDRMRLLEQERRQREQDLAPAPTEAQQRPMNPDEPGGLAVEER